MQKATFVNRLLAAIIDGLILLIPYLIFTRIFGAAAPLFNLLLGLAYQVYFIGTKGMTPGKQVIGLQVVAKDGSRMDYAKAFIRYICTIVSSIPCGLGYLWMLWDKDKETWHDKMSSTNVISTK